MAHLRLLALLLVDYGRLRIDRIEDKEAFLRAAYRTVLAREPDHEARERLLPDLRAGRLPRPALVKILFFSDEFRRLQGAAPVTTGHTELAAQVEQAFARERQARPERSDSVNWLTAAYRTLLLREPDTDACNHYLPLLEQQQISRRKVLADLVAAPEYQLVAGLPMHPIEAAHRSRIALISQVLPAAEEIVDLGGAAGDVAEGALLFMGYPHKPRSVTIVDLPPTDRIGNQWSDAFFNETVVVGPTEVRYLYRSMTDLADLPDSSADLIVSGESIEHISETDGDLVCREAYRILRPGGSFCLDTPNARLTRLQSPDEFIHPEHKKEYYVHELRDKLLAHGFEIADQRAVCPMPRSRREGRFDLREMVEHVGISDDPEDGYMFYIQAVKPC